MPFRAALPPELRTALSTWSHNPPASAAVIAEAQADLGVRFPPDYVAFLEESNGAHGNLGEGYVALDPVDDLRNLNESYELEASDTFLLIGTNGGSEGFAFDRRTTPMSVVVIPLHEPRAEDALPQGSFTDWLLRGARGDMFK